jgi:zinc protease
VEILREPAFPAADFDQIRQQEIAQIERGRTEPGTLVPQLLQAHLSDFPRSDVRHIRTIDEEIEDLKAVTLDDVKKFHQDFFGASQGELVVVGKFDPTEPKAAGDLLGSWRRSPSRIVNTCASVPPINTRSKRRTRRARSSRRAFRGFACDSDPTTRLR